jgi:TPP-dependent pyruvate/acetoin dehydrogenase alpha subunit
MAATALVRIFHDMVVIREFETMLDRIKKEGVYQGIEYQHKGPAHLVHRPGGVRRRVRPTT